MISENVMLSLIARRLGQPAPRPVPEWDSRPSLPARPPDLPHHALVERFLAELALLSGKGFRAATAAEAVGHVVDLAVAETSADPTAPGQVLISDDPLLEPLDLAAALQRAGVPTAVWRPEAGAGALRRTADQAVMGITAAARGIAETGTIALPAAPGRGRLVSLLPPIHVALLPESRLVASVAEFFRILAQEPDLPSSLALASGPSRSADIENDLSIGVHGPARVHVVLFPD